MTQRSVPPPEDEPLTPLAEGYAHLVDKLRLLYQPLVALEAMHLAGVEVLARVLGPTGRLEGPETVLEAMDSAAASMALTREILGRGLSEQAAHHLGDATGLCFIFNLPLDAMLHPSLIDMIAEVRAGRLPADRIGFELTERHPVQNVGQLSRIMDDLMSAGYKVSLDDITPATPHLGELMKLPFQALKLDRSVVVDASEAAASYIGEVVAGASRNNHQVVAEGIETPEVLARMRALGVSHGQGYLFAKPMSATDLAVFLDGFSADFATAPSGLTE